ncbi:prepilin peptidase [Candidatus Poribacteria bacterium]
MIYFLTVVLGLAIGSFLNVCIYRIPRKGSVASPKRSYCPHCEHTLSALDNVPVFSYIFLRGKCRYCKERISPRYMIVELLTAGLFVLMVHKSLALYNGVLPIALGIAATCIFAAMLVVISFIDLEFTIIPNKIVYPGLIVGLLFAIGMAAVHKDMGLLISRLLGFAIGGVAILFIVIVGSAIFRKQAMGVGDVKLMAMIGIFLGPWPHLAMTLLAASIFGTIVGIILMMARKKKMDSAIPFGPFLAIGALLSLLYGEAIWSWYEVTFLG